MARKKIKGRIIRILDRKTIVINLGQEHGIENDSIFYILGEPESVVDPLTDEVLGTVSVAKARVRASQVLDKFTIATTSWTTVTYSQNYYKNIFGDLLGEAKTQTVDEGELKVNPSDVKPWKAKSESPVKVGDEVEVMVEESEKEAEAEAATAEVPTENK